MSDNDFITEEALAKVLGVDRPTVKRHRPNVPTGGIEVRDKVIYWRTDAASALAVTLGLNGVSFQKNAPPEAASEPAAPPKKTAAPGIEELTVSSKPMAQGRHFDNPHMIKARRASGEEVYVRVLNSNLYQPTLMSDKGLTTTPMVIKAKKALAGNHWDVVGRAPWARGRF